MKNLSRKMPYLSFAITFICAFFIMKSIPLLGDDYYYTTFWGENFWALHKEHYLLANGRAIVHFFESIFVSASPIWWQVANSLFLATIAAVMTRLSDSKNKLSIFGGFIVIAAFLSIHVDMGRESVYWRAGSCNYVYPFMLLVVFWHFLVNRRSNMVFLAILGFLSAATTEQNAMMTLGVVVLYFIDVLFVKREKLSASQMVLFFIVLLGAVSVFCAPATFVRYGLETEKTLMEVMKEQIPLQYYRFIASRYMFPFILFNFGIMGAYLVFQGKKKHEIFIGLSNFVAIVSVWLMVRADDKNITLALVAGVIFAVNVFAILKKLLCEKPEGYLNAVIAIVLTVGSQFMMVASPVSGPRTMLCGLLNLVIFDLVLVSCFAKNRRISDYIVLILTLVFLVYGAKNYMNLYSGYSENFAITAINEEKIAEFKENPSESLTQYRLIHPKHGWSMPYDSKYHLYYYKIYYGLPNETEILWEVPQS